VRVYNVRVVNKNSNAHFISIRHVSSDVVTLRSDTCRHCCMARRRCCSYCIR